MNAEIVARLQRSLDGDALGFKGDLIDVTALLALLGATLGRTADRSKLSEMEQGVLDELSKVSEQVVAKTYFSKAGENKVGVAPADDQE